MTPPASPPPSIETAPGRLKLAFLGAPHVILPQDQEVRFAVDKALMLLAYLALHAHEPQRRGELGALFYPDHPEEQASVNLRQTLRRLRRALDDETTLPPYLLGTQHTLQFNSASASWLDVAEFETLIASAQHHRHRRLPVCRDCMGHLARAVALYRGDFLSGLDVGPGMYETWLQATREDLRRKNIWALRALTAHYLQRQRYAEAQTYVDRLLHLDALDEEALRAEMQLKALQGQRTLALRSYHTFKRQLLTEFNTTPEPETLRLVNALRDEQTPLPCWKQHKDTLLTQQPFSATALPNTLTSFVGRQPELAQLTRWLSSQDCRLITLTGVGGVGKTRLAMRAAADDNPAWADGVWLALLDDHSASSCLEETLCSALGLPPQNGYPPRFQLFNFLREKELLLVLDNFERMSQHAGLVKSLLDHAPRLKIIATSRHQLNLRGEQVLEVRGLDVPPPHAARTFPPDTPQAELESWAFRYSGVKLFLEHARHLNAGFSLKPHNAHTIATICQRTHGLPLGLELAAAWLRVFPCEEVLARLEHNPDFLRTFERDVPARHTSLRAVFEYSWRLLSPEERLALKRIASDGGTVTPTTLDTMPEPDLRLLVALKDKSLLQEYPDCRLGVHPLLIPFAREKALGTT